MFEIDLRATAMGILVSRLDVQRDHLAASCLDREQVVRQGICAPATYGLVNPDRTEAMERAFSMPLAVLGTRRECCRLC